MTKSGQRILVAEDEPMIRGLIIEILHGLGFEILEASSGSEALKLLGDSGSVDLVVTDLNMPGADGITVAKAARDRNPTVPVLFVGGREDMPESPRTPVPYAFLKKPFRLDELARMVGDMARHA